MSGDKFTIPIGDVFRLCPEVETISSGIVFASGILTPLFLPKDEDELKQIVGRVIAKKIENEEDGVPFMRPSHSHLEIGTCHGYDNALCRGISNPTNERELRVDYASLAGNDIFNDDSEQVGGIDFVQLDYAEHNRVFVTEEVEKDGFGHCDSCKTYFESAPCPGIFNAELNDYACVARQNQDGVFETNEAGEFLRPPARITLKKKKVEETGDGRDDDGKNCVLRCHEVCHLCKAKSFDWNDGKCLFCEKTTGDTALRAEKLVYLIDANRERKGFCFGGKTVSGGCVCADANSQPHMTHSHGLCQPCGRLFESKIKGIAGRVGREVLYSDRRPTAASKQKKAVQMRLTRDGQSSIANIAAFATDEWPDEYTEWYKVKKGSVPAEVENVVLSKSKDHDLFNPPVCPFCLRAPIFGFVVGDTCDFVLSAYGGNKVRDMLIKLFRVLWNALIEKQKKYVLSDSRDGKRYLENCKPCEECVTTEFYSFLEGWEGPKLVDHQGNPTLKELIDDAIKSKTSQLRGDEKGEKFTSPTLSNKELEDIWDGFVEDCLLAPMIDARALERVEEGQHDGNEPETEKYVGSAPRPSIGWFGCSNTSMGGRLFGDHQSVSKTYPHLQSSDEGGHLDPERKPIRYVIPFARCSSEYDRMTNVENWKKRHIECLAYCANKIIVARVGKPMLIPGEQGSRVVVVPEYFVKRGSASNGLFTDMRDGNVIEATEGAQERKVPGVRDMRDAILDILDSSKNERDTVTISCDAPIDFGGRLQIILQFAWAFPKKYHERISILFFGSPITRDAVSKATTFDAKHRYLEVPGSFSLKAFLNVYERRFNDDSIVPILTALTTRNPATATIDESHEVQRFLLSQISEMITPSRGVTKNLRKSKRRAGKMPSQLESNLLSNNTPPLPAEAQEAAAAAATAAAAAAAEEEEEEEEEEVHGDDEKRRMSFVPSSVSNDFLTNEETADMNMIETRSRFREKRVIYFLTKNDDANEEKLIKVPTSEELIPIFEGDNNELFEKITRNSRQKFLTESDVPSSKDETTSIGGTSIGGAARKRRRSSESVKPPSAKRNIGRQ
jgi:hypothetical protein